jgi:hypothetical protein
MLRFVRICFTVGRQTSSPTRERGTLKTIRFESLIETNGPSGVVFLARAAGYCGGVQHECKNVAWDIP